MFPICWNIVNKRSDFHNVQLELFSPNFFVGNDLARYISLNSIAQCNVGNVTPDFNVSDW